MRLLALAKSVLLMARYFRRISVALERIADLYELDLESKGIRRPDAALKDEVEVLYPPRSASDQW